MINAGLSTVSAKGIFLYLYFQHSSNLAFPYFLILIFIAFHYFLAATTINAATMLVVEETTRMKKARLAGLDTRGKPTEPIFLRKHKEPVGEGSTVAPSKSGHVASGSFQPS